MYYCPMYLPRHRFFGTFGGTGGGLLKLHLHLLQQRFKFGLLGRFAGAEACELVGVDGFEVFEEIHFLGGCSGRGLR